MSDIRPKLLIVEDDPGLQRQLRWAYEDYQLFIAGDREEAVELLRAHAPDVVTLDLGLPPDPDGTSEGFATLADILRIKPDTKVIVASGHGARESALDAISGGAYDFYHKPVDIDELGLIVRRAFHVHALEQENARLAETAPTDRRVLGRVLTGAPEMMKVARTIERVASAQVSVLLLGASGTGKELLAQGLHDASPRRHGAFVAINCAAIPEALLESELFGHEKGAFTGAIKTTPGKIEQAQGGTLFLDEVGDIPLALQVKLLRFLQERVIERIGGRTPTRARPRLGRGRSCKGARNGRQQRRRARPEAPLPSELLRRLCARPRGQQAAGGLPQQEGMKRILIIGWSGGGPSRGWPGCR